MHNEGEAKDGRAIIFGGAPYYQVGYGPYLPGLKNLKAKRQRQAGHLQVALSTAYEYEHEEEAAGSV